MSKRTSQTTNDTLYAQSKNSRIIRFEKIIMKFKGLFLNETPSTFNPDSGYGFLGDGTDTRAQPTGPRSLGLAASITPG